jgi:hypothetical protein
VKPGGESALIWLAAALLCVFAYKGTDNGWLIVAALAFFVGFLLDLLARTRP